MLNVEVLGITREIKLKILENVSISEIKNCAERVEDYCNRYDFIKGEVMNDYLTLKIMYRFTHYMNAVDFDWMPIGGVEFRDHIVREIHIIEDIIINENPMEFFVG